MAGWRARLPVGRKEFKRWLTRLDGQLWEIEHFKVYEYGEATWSWPDAKDITNKWPVGNCAVVVLKDGRAFVGKAMCSERDQYNHKRGFNMAVGRALKKAVVGRVVSNSADFMVPLSVPSPTLEDPRGDAPLGGVALRDYCRAKVGLG